MNHGRAPFRLPSIGGTGQSPHNHPEASMWVWSRGSRLGPTSLPLGALSHAHLLSSYPHPLLGLSLTLTLTWDSRVTKGFSVISGASMQAIHRQTGLPPAATCSRQLGHNPSPPGFPNWDYNLQLYDRPRERLNVPERQ